MFFTLTNRDGQATLSVFGETFEKVLPADHPNFSETVAYLTTTPDAEHDEEHVRGLVDPSVGIGRILQKAFGERLTFDLHNLYLDGLPITGPLSKHVTQRLLNGDRDWERFARFLVNLDDNPSKRAKEAVWKWVDANGLTITEDGCFLGYKGVTDTLHSISTGADNYVNGTYLGKPGVSYAVPYEIGSVVSKKRADVDDTPGGGCSVGLHVGTKQYATGWGSRTITVKINPADVVSVPDGGWGNDLSYKIRVCRLEVVDIAKDEYFSSTSADPVTSEHVKSPERVSTEASLVGLTKWQRRAYDGHRKDGLTHEDALGGALAEPEEEPVVAQEPEGGLDREVTAEEAQAGLEEFVEALMQSEDDEEPLEPEDVADPTQPVVPVEEGKTLADYAQRIPDLKRDLEDTTMGHKPLAAKWSDYTTESSVRRWRKAHGVHLTLMTKIRG